MGFERDRFLRKQNVEWERWLEDEPVVKPLAAGPELVKDPRYVRESGTKSSLKKKTVMVGIGLAALFMLGGAGLWLAQKAQDGGTQAVVPTGSVQVSQGNEGGLAPSLSVGASSGQESVAQAAAGQNNLTPDSPYYQYISSLKGSEVVISRQPTPSSYEQDTQAFDKFVLAMKATQKIATTRWGTAHMMSDKEVQVLVFKNEQYLVFLRSATHHTNAEWKDFIEALVLR